MKQTNLSRTLFVAVLLSLFSWATLQAQQYETITGGIQTRLNELYVRIIFLNDSTVRVCKTYDLEQFNRKSWALIKDADNGVHVQVTETGGIVALRTAKLHVNFVLSTGRATFYDAADRQLLAEGGHSFTATKDGQFDSYTLTQYYVLSDDERIYGMGQIQDGLLNRRGTVVTLEQENCKISIPYFLSSKNYGLYWDNYSPTTFSDTGSQTFFRSTGKAIDYYVLGASSSHNVQRSLRNLTGQTELPPLWNFGVYQSKERYVSANEVMNIVQRYRDQQIPLDCVVQDWQYWGDGSHWNAMEFLNPDFSNYQQMIDFVHEKNAKLMISFWPNFGPATTPYADFNSRGWLFTIQDANGSRPYNPYRSDARDLYWNYVWNGIISKGIDAYWMDATEPEFFGDDENHKNNIALEGQTFRSLRNVFPIATVGGVAEHHRAQPELADKRVSIMTRSGFLGMQRTGAYVWSADINGDWATLRKQIPAACNVSETGLPYWNSDTGGFFLGDVNNPSWCRLFVRWTQFSSFTPMLRFHGTATPREPWQFGTAGDSRGNYDAIVRYIKLRYSLLPYLYSTAHQVRTNAEVFMRGLPIAYPDDAQTYDITDQYMFGKSFLVAPVLEDNAMGRSVYLPQGDRWIDFWTGYTLDGGETPFKVAGIDLLPLYVRAGSILPWGPEVQYSSEKNWDNLELRVYPGADGKFTLYEDELDTYHYENGAYSEIPITWNESSKTLTFGARQGSFSGMLAARTFNIVVVTPDKGTGDAHTTQFDAVVNYTGGEVAVQLPAENVAKPDNDDLNFNEPLVYPTKKIAAQPVTQLEDGVEYALQNANETLACRRFMWNWENLRTQTEGNIDDLKVVAERTEMDGDVYWAFRITSNDNNGRYIGRNNDVNVQVADKTLWSATYEESTTAAGNGFRLLVKGDNDEGMKAMMMNGDGTWVVAWKSGNPGSDYTPLTTHWQFFRTSELSSAAIEEYNAARLQLYQYLREALQQYSRGITAVVTAYNSGIAVYNNENSTVEEINTAIETLRQAMAATVSLYEVDVPANYGILNPGFENLSAQHDTEANGGVNPPFGWTLTKDGSPVTDNGTWGWGSINADGDSNMEGGHVFGVWNGGSYGGIELSQTLTGLTNGSWRLTALVLVNNASNGAQTRLFAGNQSMLGGTAADYATLPQGEDCSFSGEWSTNDKDMHQRFQVETMVTDGTLHFGIRANGFFKADDFQLTYLGSEARMSLQADIEDDTYISTSLTSVTISPIAAATSATLASGTKVTLYKDDVQVSEITPTVSGANLIVALPTLERGATYKLSLTAKQVTYNTGAKNNAFEITFKTPHISDGTYYLYNVKTDDFLDRNGNDVNTTFFGAPITWTNTSGGATIKFNDSSNQNTYVGGRWYSSSNESEGNAIKWETILDNGAYKLKRIVAIDPTWEYLYVDASQRAASNGKNRGDNYGEGNFDDWDYGKWQFMTEAEYQAYVTTINETDASAPAVTGQQKVELIRTLKGGQWNSFSVPFSFTVSDSPLAGTTVKQFSSATDNVISFKDATAIEAGKPYVVKPTADIVNPRFRGVNVTNAEEAVYGDGPYKFAAHLYNTTLPTNGSVAYISNTDSSLKKLTSGGLKGLRSIFKIPTGNEVKPLVLDFDGDVTAIMDVEGNITEGGIYNLAGQRLYVPQRSAQGDASHLKKGVNIFNGKKVLVK